MGEFLFDSLRLDFGVCQAVSSEKYAIVAAQVGYQLISTDK